ncbi:hypothetical protein CRG98_048412 [Punica granatum]|uniref:Uncharacterized protein n=1 Tax=Punica granatum TaxID=22663 RepID=A0A2I0HHJ5_PUNGR|nr:hypothetical protein CRG98_048412 [Punica granatum]
MFERATPLFLTLFQVILATTLPLELWVQPFRLSNDPSIMKPDARLVLVRRQGLLSGTPPHRPLSCGRDGRSIS